MTRNVASMIGLIALTALSGCYPEKRVVWSPDGTCAAVVGGDGLYLCGEGGELSPRVAEGIKRVAWMPDSKRLLMIRAEKVKTWKELLTFLTDEQRARVQAVGERVRAQVLAYEGDMDQFDPGNLDELTDGEKGAMVLYVRDERGQGLPEKIGAKWDEIKNLEVDGWLLQLAERRPSGAEPGAVVARSVDELVGLRMSPDGGAVALVEPMSVLGGNDNLRLLAVPTDGSAPPRVVAERVAWSADWTADGRQLAYAYSSAGDGKKLRLGTVARRAVRDEAGRFLAEFPPAEDLAGTLLVNEVAVRCLKDGRILFSGMEVQLPCTADDMVQHGALFCVHPGSQPTVMRMITRASQAESAEWMYFEVSPDGRHVYHAGSDGQVSVLSLATGKSWTVMDRSAAGGKLQMVPVWRSADELCCVAHGAEGSGREIVMLFKLDWDKQTATGRDISANWPDAVVKGFLVEEKQPAAETQPVEK